jgi:hypothetical protein
VSPAKVREHKPSRAARPAKAASALAATATSVAAGDVPTKATDSAATAAALTGDKEPEKKGKKASGKSLLAALRNKAKDTPAATSDMPPPAVSAQQEAATKVPAATEVSPPAPAPAAVAVTVAAPIPVPAKKAKVMVPSSLLLNKKKTATKEK